MFKTVSILGGVIIGGWRIRLKALVRAKAVVEKIRNLFVQGYGFSLSCHKVFSCNRDNPAFCRIEAEGLMIVRQDRGLAYLTRAFAFFFMSLFS